MASAAKATIAICTYDRYDLLPKAIASAAGQALPPADYRILVIDNSPDYQRALAFGKTFGEIANLSYIVEKTPGLSNARNLAARICETPVIAFIDDDAIAEPDWLAELLAAYDAFGAKTMIVGGRVDPIWGAPRPPWLPDALLGYLSVVDYGGDARPARPAEWFAGTNISFRTEAILKNGGFATNLGRIGSGNSLLSNEEIQLLERIRERGGKLVYAPKAGVRHLVDEKRLSRTWFRKRAAWQAMSDFMMNADKAAATGSNAWQGALRYFNKMPPHERTIRGLAYDTDDPELFEGQIGAIYMSVVLLLTGFQGVALD
jgi:glucosyl-dolichyl phosphate glucuronosyltransferase